MLVSANEGGLELSRCGDHGEEHCVERCWHTSCFFLETAYCSASHDSNCCAYLMLVTECVTSQTDDCYAWLQKLVDIGSWTASENLFTQWQNLFLVFLSTNLLARSHSCVSSTIVPIENSRCMCDRPRQNRRVCCHFKRRDFVFENCQTCFSNSTHCGDGLLRGSIAPMSPCW